MEVAHNDIGKNSCTVRIQKNTVQEKRRMWVEQKKRKCAINACKRRRDLQNAL